MKSLRNWTPRAIILLILTMGGCQNQDYFDSAGQPAPRSAESPITALTPTPIPTNHPAAGPIYYEPPGNLAEGIRGGHFDLDTSTQIYDFYRGMTNTHVHEYDDAYQTNGADFFKLLQPKLNEIQESIGDLAQRFILVIGNGQLSPGAQLAINGKVMNAYDYQLSTSKSGAVFPVFTLGVPVKPGDQRLQELKIFFDPEVIKTGGLIPTVTRCVRENFPGKNQEYRNGALVIQALNAEHFALDPITHLAQLNGGGLLWEATIFWHRDGVCYGAANYVR